MLTLKTVYENKMLRNAEVQEYMLRNVKVKNYDKNALKLTIFDCIRTNRTP